MHIPLFANENATTSLCCIAVPLYAIPFLSSLKLLGDVLLVENPFKDQCLGL
jgi:hypothetical protein